ncbi:MAG: hypothetical protein DBX59_03285 [Bacillota bacterium]|nr:MAG: hypothetical protein DBX59_03285 [Bacillota bacterium]
MQEYEYKVASYKKLKKAEQDMNKQAEDGWRVQQSHLEASSGCLIVIYERKYRV